MFSPVVFLNEDPRRVEFLCRRARADNYAPRPDASLVATLSALEIACLDIAGKACGLPIHDFLGGKTRARLRAYTYLYPEAGDKADVYADPAQAARRAADCRDLGFTAVKFDPLDKYGAFDPRQLRLTEISRARLFAREIRAAVGDDCDLLFGSHGQMTAAAAIRLARELEPFLPLWFEEPTPPECPAAAAEVARATSIPIATGERLSTAHDFARVLDCGAAAILQPNLGRVGGIGEAKKNRILGRDASRPNRAAFVLRPDRGGGEHSTGGGDSEFFDSRIDQDNGRLLRRDIENSVALGERGDRRSGRAGAGESN